jgi:hypothetical protein
MMVTGPLRHYINEVGSDTIKELVASMKKKFGYAKKSKIKQAAEAAESCVKRCCPKA